MQHRLLPVQLNHHRRSTLGMQRILDLLSNLLHTGHTALLQLGPLTYLHITGQYDRRA